MNDLETTIKNLPTRPQEINARLASLDTEIENLLPEAIADQVLYYINEKVKLEIERSNYKSLH